MEYTKTNWRDLPDTTTPITADRLNNMENGIEYLFEHGVGGGDTLPIGIILPFSDDTIPEGYMLCDGAAISRTTYATLFSVIGTTYGVGDGSTTFNIPNLKGKVPVGYDSSDNDFDTLGKTGGEKSHVLTIVEMPNHAHTFQFDQTAGSMADVIKTGAQSSYGKATSAVGGGEAHNNLQPYQVINYIIKVLNAQNGEVRSESLPIGIELDYDGQINNIPSGWEVIEGNIGELQNSTPEIINATATYATRECKYEYINKNTIIGTVVIRANISALSTPSYARIKLNIPNIDMRTWSSFAVIQEAKGGTEVLPYSAVFVDNNAISLQKDEGTGATEWIIADNIYIRLGFIIHLN